MTKLADLHIHTYYSDGTLSPQEVVVQAKAAGLSCIAITDHDTIDGIQPTIESARLYDLEVISGIELSTELNGKEIDILGYFFDWQNSSLHARLAVIQAARVERMKKMIERLVALGIRNIHFEEVCGLAQTKALGRPHLAALLVKKGIVTTMKRAFDKFLAKGALAYVPKFKQTPQEGIRLIKGWGGIAVLAHPMLSNVDELIAGFVRDGLGGLEVYYPHCLDSVIHFYEGLAKKYGVVVTGGSDAHGQARQHAFIGKVRIPYDLVERLKQAVNGK